jgi:hypothetical protein
MPRLRDIFASSFTREATMADDDNPLEGAEFAAALTKLEGTSPEAAKLINMLRDAVTELQEQVYSGDDEDDDDED